jgi:ribose transport system ATP-binding protein
MEPAQADAGREMTGEPILVCDAVTKRFPGVTALDHVDVRIMPHEVVGLVGANGSGKSTLLKILAGIYAPDEGTIALRSRTVRFGSPAEARKAGVGMVFQEQSLLPNLTVAENIMLGAEGGAFDRGLVKWPALRAAAKEQLRKIGYQIDVEAPTESLSLGQRQMIELAKALSTEEHSHSEPLILLDEATTMLAASEIAVLFEQIERLRQRASVVFVSHRLDEIIKVCDRLYVLRDGKVVGERSRDAFDQEEILSLMVGTSSGSDYYHTDKQIDDLASEVRLSVSGLGDGRGFRNISFDLRRGEVLGICGIEGSGRDALLRALFGVNAVVEGGVRLDGEQIRIRDPVQAVAFGIGHIPAERRAEANFDDLSIATNISAANLKALVAGVAISLKREVEQARKWIERLNIRTPSERTLLRALSGGNQQKVVFARWMTVEGLRVLLLDHPTRGLDVKAKGEIYAIIRELSAAGTSILLLSDSIEEIIALSHRVLAMKDGRITAELSAPQKAKPAPIDIIPYMV